jgi:hypothetical protein
VVDSNDTCICIGTQMDRRQNQCDYLDFSHARTIAEKISEID